MVLLVWLIIDMLFERFVYIWLCVLGSRVFIFLLFRLLCVFSMWKCGVFLMWLLGRCVMLLKVVIYKLLLGLVVIELM